MSKAVTEAQKIQARERSRHWRAQRLAQDPEGFRAAEAQRIAARRALQKAGVALPERPGARGARIVPIGVLVVDTPVFLTVLPAVEAVPIVVTSAEPEIVSIAPVAEEPEPAVDTLRHIPSVLERMRAKNGNLRNRRYG